MDRILAIETSTLTGSVALMEGERVVVEEQWEGKEGHAPRLLPAID
ncbi:MAG: tRNA (adenosine(37)-N6)-threonylcarbamoyltransferase complex dimerization subunit type 1 TsaB, partial [Deltaproteobacteria bacterium]|nr:tRNA (adenosine(37)-N6)-threonylcarbamoyltransferase complex dimerization subunit type 1 TsaB [Deltaproteobacteria bacterium]